MLLRGDVLDRIRDGSVTLAFRCWRRPTVRSGGTSLTAIGKLRIASVAAISEAAVTDAQARRAGYASRQALLDALDRHPEGEIYRIEFGGIAPDPRVELREAVSDGDQIDAIRRRLEQFDRRSAAGPWTRRVLGLLADEPGVRAEILARRIGVEKLVFKSNVRKLKTLGLTISLGTGYRLSPRGAAFLAAPRKSADAAGSE